jgi:hypothetical protein
MPDAIPAGMRDSFAHTLIAGERAATPENS